LDPWEIAPTPIGAKGAAPLTPAIFHFSKKGCRGFAYTLKEERDRYIWVKRKQGPEGRKAKMPPTAQELSLLINPVVPDSVLHNTRALSDLHSLTSFLLGLSAGILGLRSYNGFIFYLLGTLFVSLLFHGFLVGFGERSGAGMGVGAYFPGNGELVERDGKGVRRKGAWRDVWLGGGVMGEALSGFVLGWAGVGGVLR